MALSKIGTFLILPFPPSFSIQIFRHFILSAIIFSNSVPSPFLFNGWSPFMSDPNGICKKFVHVASAGREGVGLDRWGDSIGLNFWYPSILNSKVRNH